MRAVRWLVPAAVGTRGLGLTTTVPTPITHVTSPPLGDLSPEVGDELHVGRIWVLAPGCHP
jgi:hypothetical protein